MPHSVNRYVLFVSLLVPGAARADGSVVTGMVRYAGPKVTGAPLQVTQDDKVCGKSRPDEALLVDAAGGVKNVVVSIEGVAGAPKPAPGSATLDQKQCQFLPHVQAVPAGSSLTIGNSDDVLHNVHGWRLGNTLFNLAMPAPNTTIKRKLLQPGLNTFRCDAGHVWMAAYVWTFDHPYYAVTDEKGRFSIAGVPPGSYKVRVWHEGWKRKDPKSPALTTEVVVERPVTIEAGKPSDVTVELK